MTAYTMTQTTHESSECTSLEPDASDIAVIVPLPAAELRHIDGDGGSDLLLGQTQTIVEDLKKLF